MDAIGKNLKGNMVDFSGFSADSFEQLVRALATKILGPGVMSFGDGPDGGREATFSGRVPYPFPPDQIWDGYGVFQAKFKSSNEGHVKDQAWALLQAKGELDKWMISKKRKPKAEYFIFCTNVTLSSASGGGKDKLQKLFNLKKYGLKGHAIWDANQLTVHIDNASDIRNRFRALFTPGDLLAVFAEKLQLGDTVDGESVLTTYIARELATDEDARLSQAGDRSEDQIRLADVFVDLPSGPEARTEPELKENNGLQPASLSELLRVGALKLDPLALFEEHETLKKTNSFRRPSGPIARFVYLGGPGSGKSTIGQVLAQIHRAALLDRRPTYRLEENIRLLVQTIKDRCKQDGYEWPQTPRYPFRVELNYFAKALSGNNDLKVTSLSDYLRRTLSRNILIEHKHLRSWLASYPCLLILDGLDEVPASSNRKQVIEAIQEFLNEARELESDLQIVASSRPDGYAGEFDGAEVAHRYLHPLSAERAILCAEKYVHAKIAKKDDHRAAEVVSTLRSSIKNPLIAKLMYSPLQVTFMVTVVAASGKPSESRWRLFSEYYKTIYERELQKAVPPFDRALSARRSDIDALHHRVGFILQNRAEISGGTQSDMSIGEFKSLVAECLGEHGLSNELLKHEVEMIVGAANQRLVFLTSRTPSRLSFDVRSLQEYMAAACLTNTDSTEAMPRLKQIGHSAYWRNVTMFAVGRFFDEPQLRDQREKIRIFCEDLNQQNGKYERGLVGSRLAVDVLISGVMGEIPNFSRALGKIAIELLEFPPIFTSDEQNANLLAQVYNPAMEVDFKNAISLRLGQIDTDRSISAWSLLNQLIENKVSWAHLLWAEHWQPLSLRKQKEIFESFFTSSNRSVKLGRHLSSVATVLIPKLDPFQVREVFGQKVIISHESTPNWLRALLELLDGKHSTALKIYREDESVGVDVHFRKLEDFNEKVFLRFSDILEEPNTNSSWLPIDCIVKFVANPTRDALVDVFDILSKDESNRSFWKFVSPWPIAQQSLDPASRDILKNLAKDAKPWLQAEKSVIEHGLELSTIFQIEIASNLVSMDSLSSWFVDDGLSGNRGDLLPKAALDALGKVTDTKRKHTLANIFSGMTSISDSLQNFDPVMIYERVVKAKDCWIASSFSLKIKPDEKVSPAWERFFIRFGEFDLLPPSNRRIGQRAPLARWCLERFVSDQSQLGLLKIAGLCATSLNVKFTTEVLKSGYDLDLILRQAKDIQTKFAAIAIELIIVGSDQQRIQFAANELKKLLQDKKYEWGAELILNVFDSNQLQGCGRIEFLNAIVDSESGKKWTIRSFAEVIRTKLLEDESSGFTSECLTKLRLPQGENKST